MSRILSSRLATLFRRAFTVAAESMKGQPSAPTTIGKAVDQMASGGGAVGKKAVEKEINWMRDPKTGNWKPETHFDEVDIVDLRDKILKQTKLKL